MDIYFEDIFELLPINLKDYKPKYKHSKLCLTKDFDDSYQISYGNIITAQKYSLFSTLQLFTGVLDEEGITNIGNYQLIESELSKMIDSFPSKLDEFDKTILPVDEFDDEHYEHAFLYLEAENKQNYKISYKLYCEGCVYGEVVSFIGSLRNIVIEMNDWLKEKHYDR